MSMENHGRMLSKGEDSFFHQSFLTVLPAVSSSNKAGGTGEGNDKFGLSIFVHTMQVSLTCRKLLRHGAGDFTSPPKKGVLKIFIALKIHRPRPGLNPRTLGPMAGTIPLHHRGRLHPTSVNGI
jgi:hypothetical protein